MEHLDGGVGAAQISFVPVLVVAVAAKPVGALESVAQLALGLGVLTVPPPPPPQPNIRRSTHPAKLIRLFRAICLLIM
jgi:hypothetical protein